MINMFLWYVTVCVYSDVSKGLPQNLNLATNIDFWMALTDLLFCLLCKEEYQTTEVKVIARCCVL